MKIQHQKSTLHKRAILLLALPALGLGALAVAQDKKPDSKPETPPTKETAAQKFKNIKVLKNLPADQLIPKMHEYNTALNVKCNFCHVVNAEHNAWDKDDVPMKAVARQMIGVVNDLNAHQKSLNGRATCYMCHQGHPEPITSTPETAQTEKK